MADAGLVLVGAHDFAAFRATGSSIRSTARKLFELTVKRVPRSSWSLVGGSDSALTIIEARGSGFLRHMMRVIVGTLVEVGRGQRDRAAVKYALHSRERGSAGQTAPPHGLFLVRVDYGPAL